MSSFILRSIALITMIIDHTGAVLYPQYHFLRIIGRIAFPLYCFLLIEGYTHTRDVKKYLTRLLAFALLSEAPFDYAFFGGLEFSHQNIFFTLFLGLFAVYIIDTKGKELPFVSLFAAVIAMVAAVLLNTDYSFVGIIYILIFYYTKDMKGWMRYGVALAALVTVNFLLMGGTQNYAFLAFLFIPLYNHKPGLKNWFFKYFHYVAYPLHLFILHLIDKAGIL